MAVAIASVRGYERDAIRRGLEAALVQVGMAPTKG